MSETLLAARRSFRSRDTNAARRPPRRDGDRDRQARDEQRLRELDATETIDYTRQDIADVIASATATASTP